MIGSKMSAGTEARPSMMRQLPDQVESASRRVNSRPRMMPQTPITSVHDQSGTTNASRERTQQRTRGLR